MRRDQHREGAAQMLGPEGRDRSSCRGINALDYPLWLLLAAHWSHRRQMTGHHGNQVLEVRETRAQQAVRFCGG